MLQLIYRKKSEIHMAKTTKNKKTTIKKPTYMKGIIGSFIGGMIAAAAISAGNCVILKPSHHAQASAQLLTTIIK